MLIGLLIGIVRRAGNGGPGAGVDNLLLENSTNLLAEDGTVLKLE